MPRDKIACFYTAFGFFKVEYLFHHEYVIEVVINSLQNIMLIFVIPSSSKCFRSCKLCCTCRCCSLWVMLHYWCSCACFKGIYLKLCFVTEINNKVKNTKNWNQEIRNKCASFCGCFYICFLFLWISFIAYSWVM